MSIKYTKHQDDITDIMIRLEKFRDDRDWKKYHQPSELARAISIEAAELNELFLWDADHNDIGVEDKRVKEELSDVMIYCLNMCLAKGYDPVEIINSKIDMNAVKHPVNHQA